jgi:DNA helicase-2/ATP-dependent DNA helicase PcrA
LPAAKTLPRREYKAELPVASRAPLFTHGQNAQGDRHVYASRSRFIPDELLGRFEPTTWPEAQRELAATGASQDVRVDIAARMRGMWR